jgi:sugar transferase (PEP-CTERM/EpsH1 system associated)
MKRIRIIHVIDSLGTGGAESGIRKLLAGLDASLFEQTVCTVAPGPASESESGARVISLSRAGSEKRKLLVPQLIKVFRRERPDIVHSRNWGTIEAVPAARLARVKTVVHSEHGLELATLHRQPWRRNAMRRLCFAWANRVFAVSEDLSRYYAGKLRIRKDRIGVIANGVDCNKFSWCIQSRVIMRQQLGIENSTVVIGTVGRLDPIKDHRTLFQALDLLLLHGIPALLVIVGDGPERKILENDARARGEVAKRIRFVGESKDVLSHLCAFDIFALPSLAEGMSNALLEAMAAGLACVATRVGGNPELIQHGKSGLLFEPGRVAALAGYLKSLATDAPLRHSLGMNARSRIQERFSLQRMLSDYTGLYLDAAEHRQPSPAMLDYKTLARTPGK